jgi:uncharacterized protein YabN with tetrapyrrole methylase and pyrophosphatase domain
MKRRGGSLSAVGIGIRSPAQATFEAAARIQNADKVFSLVPDPIAEYWVRTLNQNTESLGNLYAVGKDRIDTYREIIERITSAVRQSFRVCAVSYGHPGVAAYPFHESVRLARAEGFPAEMFAGVSAEDCLFAELGVDPINGGCLSYEATDYLLRRRVVDLASNLVLWQIGVIAESGYRDEPDIWNREGLLALTERLLEVYRPDHEVVVYEAAQLSLCGPMVERIPLASLPDARVTAMSTLFVPPMAKAPLDESMLKRLGLRQTSRARTADPG